MGTIFWFTGLSGAGKTTLADGLHQALVEGNHRSVVLDGDVVRKGLNRDLGFTREDRMENNRRIAEVARLLRDSGLIVLVSCISPMVEDRRRNRSICGETAFYEVFVDCPLAVCEERDVKGLYKKARLGLLPEFTGVSAPYEPPVSPDFVVKTGEYGVSASLEALLRFVSETLTR